MGLVTDYTELNKHMNRPIHLFAHMTKILQVIPPEAKFFAKMDAVHGYFQLGLEEESSRMTTFLLRTSREVPLPTSPDGTECIIRRMVLPLRCNNQRAPMGKKKC